MKTDEIFYRLFSDCPEAFFELIGESVPDAGGYEFTSEEVKEISFRLDGIFQPPVGETDNPFWVVEVQFQKKEDLYSRLFTELFIYLRRRQPERDWRAVVIFPTRSVEPSGESQWYREFFESGRVLRIYLDELPPSLLYSGPGG